VVFEINPGVLRGVTVHGDGYYRLMDGVNPDGERRQVLTRGKSCERGATRIPIHVGSLGARFVAEEILQNTTDLVRVMEAVVRRVSLVSLSLLLVDMPREGNKISGREWNAPGGTGEPDETPDQIAVREFDEESDLTVLCAGNPFPEWLQFASGPYDEVQTISFALVTGKPAKLVEGGRQWISQPLHQTVNWMHDQNQRQYPSRWEKGEFIPVDGKVYFAVRWLVEHLRS
jgi:8-oxo-dGTP pyrophosphatase MutT (NUDIX family)